MVWVCMCMCECFRQRHGKSSFVRSDSKKRAVHKLYEQALRYVFVHLAELGRSYEEATEEIYS